ncbi:2'-5' RNA ligase family protein [Aeromicrobium sp. P5_D10]
MRSAEYLDPGHTVLAVPVPELDAYVRARTRHYDAAYEAADPEFGQAHITLLGPWRRAPSAADIDLVSDFARRAEPFEFSLADVAVFPDGIIHLLTDPEERFAAMTAELVELFPDHQPYEGRSPDVVPHLTLDAVGPGVGIDSVRESLTGLVPARCRAEEVQLQWWQAGACHVQRSWRFGVRSEEVRPEKVRSGEGSSR